MQNQRRNNKTNVDPVQELIEQLKNSAHDIGVLNITINYNITIGNKHVEQRAEGGGQINRNVGTNANQGGQNALNHSQTRNERSNFADGNGRSGIAGNDNDEAGGQQGIKVRDSIVEKSTIYSSSAQSGSEDPES